MTTETEPRQHTEDYLLRSRFSPTATLEEERREVFDGVIESLRAQPPDDDRMAACQYLLLHLARTEPRC
jgi:hypothetical protein